MFQNEAPVVIKIYSFYQNLYLEIRKWPKPERYNLGRLAENLTLQILEKTLSAWRSSSKKENIFQANIKLQMLKIVIRLAKDLEIITSKKYLFLEKELFNIGCQLGNWQKS
jgi:hypothetical protein